MEGHGIVEGGNRREWMEMEAVRVVCDQGWIPHGPAFSHCQDGVFTPRRLKCIPRGLPFVYSFLDSFLVAYTSAEF